MIKSIFRKIRSLVKTVGRLIYLLPKFFWKLVVKLFRTLRQADPSLFTHQAKGQVVKAKHKTINFYKRPISDISHLSIMIVIVL
ncbi:MAG: hypothetical protein PHU86_04010, partial [Patescibacteria group bacterium]|nr:hypothetical protein [Patescibacteria group bacterium]